MCASVCVAVRVHRCARAYAALRVRDGRPCVCGLRLSVRVRVSVHVCARVRLCMCVCVRTRVCMRFCACAPGPPYVYMVVVVRVHSWSSFFYGHGVVCRGMAGRCESGHSFHEEGVGKSLTHVSRRDLNAVSKSVVLGPHLSSLSSWWHRLVIICVLTSTSSVDTPTRHTRHCTPSSCPSVDAG